MRSFKRNQYFTGVAPGQKAQESLGTPDLAENANIGGPKINIGVLTRGSTSGNNNKPEFAENG